MSSKEDETASPSATGAETAAATSAGDEKTNIPGVIPETMKRLVVMKPGKDVKSCQMEIQTVPVPKPGPGQVLIKVVAAAVNPSDYGSWIRCRQNQCPFAMGNEGCGVVVATGGGFKTYSCPVGTKVGFVGLKNKQGSYSEYVVIDAMGGAFPMPNDLPIQDAASFFVNPYTAIAILDTVKYQHGSKVFVHTAAASQLGQMLVKLVAQDEGNSNKMDIINVVRRKEQAELLQSLGAKHVIVTGGTIGDDDDDSWKKELQNKVEVLGATVAFDAVAGDMTGTLVNALPNKGTVYVYGALSQKDASNIDPMQLIYKDKQVKGFMMNNWIYRGGPLATLPRLLAASRRVNPGLQPGGWCSSQFKDITLDQVQQETSNHLETSITGQKLRVRFDL